MRYKLDAPFASISGVVARIKHSDGSRTNLIARKDGTLYWQTIYPRRGRGNQTQNS